jgi:hypothetical protein
MVADLLFMVRPLEAGHDRPKALRTGPFGPPPHGRPARGSDQRNEPAGPAASTDRTLERITRAAPVPDVPLPGGLDSREAPARSLWDPVGTGRTLRAAGASRFVSPRNLRNRGGAEGQ